LNLTNSKVLNKKKKKDGLIVAYNNLVENLLYMIGSRNEIRSYSWSGSCWVVHQRLNRSWDQELFMDGFWRDQFL
jgi:hypothetical protein